MTAYDELMAFQRETEALAQVAGRLGWDQETMMPRGAPEQRGEEWRRWRRCSTPAAPIRAWATGWRRPSRRTRRAAHLRHIRRDHERNRKVPARLAAEIARSPRSAQGIWAGRGMTEDFAPSRRRCPEIVRLRREEAAALAAGGDLYDALLDDYEPGMTGGEHRGRCSPRCARGLVALRERSWARTARAGSGQFPEEGSCACRANSRGLRL
jgi:carboxypeptidase Taq